MLTNRQRSFLMSKIRSKNTKAEIAISTALWHKNIHYRKHNKSIFGTPDLSIKKYKLAIFVDSEFFHGKDWETKKKPVTNAAFWEKKITRNIERDKEVNAHLESAGWTVLRFLSNDIKKNLDEIVATIERIIAIKKSKVIKIYDEDNLQENIAAESN